MPVQTGYRATGRIRDSAEPVCVREAGPSSLKPASMVAPRDYSGPVLYNRDRIITL
ncbi:hypothetical protein ZHAS_00017469 [Anopheles sinensis]|uniref:Uncharacterized protein n=1 Tax=Anopheles sinensis TaxID=74873 RepID=A0A084WGM7_ANOSI|nr:hypothetical protein ZHAS_00017469 [Anopheles sinensis]